MGFYFIVCCVQREYGEKWGGKSDNGTLRWNK